MLTLALETSSRNNSVAVLDNHSVLSQKDHESYLREIQQSGSNEHSAAVGASSTLMPLLDGCLSGAGITSKDLDLICVTRGPGMFTPLRVGVVTAKTIAFVHQTPIIPVNTLEVMACRSAARHQLESGQIVRVAINAQRRQLFSACFRVQQPWKLESLNQDELVDAKQWAESVQPDEFLTGTGLGLVPEEQVRQLQDASRVQIESVDQRQCDAESVARVALAKFEAGVRGDFWSLEPFYFRPSAAEEVLLQKKLD